MKRLAPLFVLAFALGVACTSKEIDANFPPIPAVRPPVQNVPQDTSGGYPSGVKGAWCFDWTHLGPGSSEYHVHYAANRASGNVEVRTPQGMKQEDIGADGTAAFTFPINQYGTYPFQIFFAGRQIASDSGTVMAGPKTCDVNDEAKKAGFTPGASEPGAPSAPEAFQPYQQLAQPRGLSVEEIMIVLGALLFLLGLVFVGLDVFRGGPPVGKGNKDEPGAGPLPPPPPHVPASAPTHCDWAAYYMTDQGWGVAKSALANECCRYFIEIKARVSDASVAGRGRQEVERDEKGDLVPGIPGGRFRIPLAQWDARGLGLSAEVGARSGPSGTLDWMHGLGDLPEAPEPTDPAALTWKEAYEEPPDVCAHLDVATSTTINIRFESGCGRPHHYNAFADAVAGVTAEAECTNHQTGPCPVQLTAQGMIVGSSIGDVKYTIDKKAVGDPEIGKDGTIAGVAHWHPERDRPTFTDEDHVQQTAVLAKNDFYVDIGARALIDAGLAVPPAAWPATDRVTAHVRVALGQDLLLNAAMDPCGQSPCACGMEVCDCVPAFTLRIQGATGTLQVVGVTFRLSRPPLPNRAEDHAWLINR